jgi:hypothetical protein
MPIKIRMGSRRSSIVAAAVGGLEPPPPHRWIRPSGWGCSSWTFSLGSCRCRSLSWSVTVVQVAERNHRARSKGVAHVDVEDNSCLKHVKRMSTQSSPTCYANYHRIFCPTSRSELLCVRETRGVAHGTQIYTDSDTRYPTSSEECFSCARVVGFTGCWWVC